MPVLGFIVAVLGSALYGFVVGVGWFGIYCCEGAPGGTGMEILVVPVLTVVALTTGTIAAALSLLLPRTSLRWATALSCLCWLRSLFRRLRRSLLFRFCKFARTIRYSTR
jgi:hypothetical protein